MKIRLYTIPILCLILMCSCTVQTQTDNEGLSVVAASFIGYDFARSVCADSAELELLLPPGGDSHSYEPSPADIIKINNSDIFIYTGEIMEAWAHTLLMGSDFKGVVVDMSQGVELNEEEGHEEHGHDADPHIWTDPKNAVIMVENVLNGFSLADGENKDEYAGNAQAYIQELHQLDKEFEEMIAQSKRKEMVFGGKFPFHYFEESYGLGHMSAFDSCFGETEPSAKVIIELIDHMNENGIKVIFHTEMESTKVCEEIAEKTGARLLLMHSCHNLTKDEFGGGATYLQLMRQNLENLREGLG